MGEFSDFPNPSPECLMCTSAAGRKQHWFSLCEMSWTLSSAYLMLFSGILAQLKMEMKLIGFFCVCQTLADAHNSEITLEMCPEHRTQIF